MVRILTGPIVGTVTPHSIRLLLELDTSCLLRAICTESKNHDGSHTTVDALQFEARRPRAVTIDGLRSATEYVVEFVVDDSAGSMGGVDDEGRPISVLGEDELENGEERVAQVATFGRKGEEHNDGKEAASAKVTQPTDIVNGTSSWAHRVAVVSGNDQAKVTADGSMWNTLSDRVYANKVKTLDMVIHASGQVRGEEAFKKAKEMLAPTAEEADLSEEKQSQVAELYRDLYRKNWNHEPIRKLLASVSNLMFWGSMDIFDGWGSQESHRSADSIDFKIATIARRVCWEYQRQLWQDMPAESDLESWSKGHEGYHHVQDTLGILFVDTVTSRTFAHESEGEKCVLSSKQLEDIKSKLSTSDSGAFRDVSALLCVTSSPIAFAPQDSDLAKHFASEGNSLVNGEFKEDRAALLDAVTKWRAEETTRNVLLVAGGTPCGCHSILTADGTTLEQLITSPVCSEIPSNAKGILSCEGKEHAINNVKVAHSDVCVEENLGVVDIFLSTESKKRRTTISTFIIKQSSSGSSSTTGGWEIQGAPENQNCCVIS